MPQKLQFSVENVQLLEEAHNSQFATVKFDAFASGDNAHHIIIPLEVLKKAAFTLIEKPILWFFDVNFLDAGSHSESEVPCGFISKDSPLEFRDLDDGRCMLSVVGKIWKRYSGRLMDILERDDGVKSVSVELDLLESKKNEMGFAEAVEMCFDGITILGDIIQPAIKNAQMTVLQFAEKERSEYKEIYQQEFAKYEELDFKISSTIKNNAKEGLELYKKFGKGGNSVSLATARHLLNNEESTPERIRYIAKKLSKFNTSLEDKESSEWTAWQLHGGNAARVWAIKLVDQMNKKDEEKLSYFSDDTKKDDNENNGNSDGEVYMEKNENEGKEAQSNMEDEKDKVEEKEEKQEDENKEEMAATLVDENKNEENQGKDNKEEEAEKEDYSLSSYLDLAAMLGFLEDDTENYREVAEKEFARPENEQNFARVMGVMYSKMSKLSAKCEQMAAEKAEVEKKFAEKEEMLNKMAAEVEELKKFRYQVEQEKFSYEIALVMNEIKEDMPKDEYELLQEKAKEFSLENVDMFKNLARAKAFEFSKGKKKNGDGITRIALVNPNVSGKKSSIWD